MAKVSSWAGREDEDGEDEKYIKKSSRLSERGNGPAAAAAAAPACCHHQGAQNAAEVQPSTSQQRGRECVSASLRKEVRTEEEEVG